LPADSELARAIAVLARAQQDAAWNRGQLSNPLRSHLKQYFPAALAAFQVKGVGLDSREARAVLAVAPDPAAAAKLPATRLGSVLRKAGRQRNIEAWAGRLRAIFAGDYLHQLPAVERAMGRRASAVTICSAAARTSLAGAAWLNRSPIPPAGRLGRRSGARDGDGDGPLGAGEVLAVAGVASRRAKHPA